jgi:excisionase family DNA binding protein
MSPTGRALKGDARNSRSGRASLVSEPGLRDLPDPQTEPTVTVDRAGDVLGISRSTALRKVNSGEIPSIRMGRRILIPSAKLVLLARGELVPRPVPAASEPEAGQR